MRLAYLSADLPHLQFSANRLARGTSKPTTGNWDRLKTAARYLKTHGRWVQEYRRQEPMTLIDILADSDRASDKTDRKSVSCVVTMIGEQCIRCQTATPSAPAWSSGEAEYVGNVKGASIGIGVQSMARDFGDERGVENCNRQQRIEGHRVKTWIGQTPSSSTQVCCGYNIICEAKCSCQSKRLEVHIQQTSAAKALVDNDMKRIMNKLGFREKTGRQPKALLTAVGAGSTAPAGEGDGEGLSQLTALD